MNGSFWGGSEPLDIPPMNSTYLGGSGDDWTTRVVFDSTGDLIVTGATGSSSFPTTSGCYDSSQNGGLDVFVMKMDPTCSKVIFSTFVGGSYDDIPTMIAIDSSDDIYVCGYTKGNFPVTSGCYDSSYNGGQDCFAFKMNGDGSSLIYSTHLGGSGLDNCFSGTVDTDGCFVLTGMTESSGFPTTSGAYDTSHNGQRDVFVTKINETGQSLVLSTFLGGSSYDE
ncbi:MAG: SBBP repeat-containing protein, partial [Candidatus Thermoplasmatota archaeon]|nr:SBBP repeat-containing protein [Candidatus Thermoplasmatota archaeon]